ncbi:hypothetical protein [Larkinella rosea]|nr:hypothetical protein [Larkinella rosea]
MQALASGVIGAGVLTALHETARHYIDDAPRADVLGMRAIRNTLTKIDVATPSDEELHDWALGGDLVSNALYYSLVGLAKPRYELLAGTALGLAAGIGAVGLTGPLGLGTAPTQRTASTAAMTISWYVIGGLAAAGAYALLKRR